MPDPEHFSGLEAARAGADEPTAGLHESYACSFQEETDWAAPLHLGQNAITSWLLRCHGNQCAEACPLFVPCTHVMYAPAWTVTPQGAVKQFTSECHFRWPC